MSRSFRWFVLAPMLATGVVLAGVFFIPPLDGSEESPVESRQVPPLPKVYEDKSAKSPSGPPVVVKKKTDSVVKKKTDSDVPWLIDSKSTAVKTTRRTASPRVRQVAGVGENPLARKPEEEKADADSRIPAKGPDAGKSVNPDQPIPAYRKSIGAQDASLTVDWVTPESIIVMQQGKFDLVLRNRGRVAIEQITITNVLPKGFRFVKAEPKATHMKPSRTWIVDKLEPQEEARITLFLVPLKVGEAQSHARVDFHVASTASFRVVQPKLKIAVDGSKQVLVGNQAIFNTTITNPGSGKTTNIRMKAYLPKGLEAVAKGTIYEIGTLNPGESRTVRVLAKVNEIGEHKVRFVTIADGLLRDEVETHVTGLEARLDVAISGPTFRYMARPAKFKVVVKNTGNAPAHNVSLNCRVPRAFAYLTGTQNGRFDASTKTINWYVGTLEVGKQMTAEFNLKAVDRGKFPILAQANADRGITASDNHDIRVDGIAAILLEVVDVDDPIEVGAVTYYEILVTNQGTEFAKNIRITAKMPEGITLLGAKGPSKGVINGRTITFEPLEKLAPRADAIYRIKVRTDKVGDLRIEAQAMSDALTAPVKELESTRVYQD